MKLLDIEADIYNKLVTMPNFPHALPAGRTAKDNEVVFSVTPTFLRCLTNPAQIHWDLAKII